jgi:hypothetical protein
MIALSNDEECPSVPGIEQVSRVFIDGNTFTSVLTITIHTISFGWIKQTYSLVHKKYSTEHVSDEVGFVPEGKEIIGFKKRQDVCSLALVILLDYVSSLVRFEHAHRIYNALKSNPID